MNNRIPNETVLVKDATVECPWSLTVVVKKVQYNCDNGILSKDVPRALNDYHKTLYALKNEGYRDATKEEADETLRSVEEAKENQLDFQQDIRYRMRAMAAKLEELERRLSAGRLLQS